jgi:hypothetical protein
LQRINGGRKRTESKPETVSAFVNWISAIYLWKGVLSVIYKGFASASEAFHGRDSLARIKIESDELKFPTAGGS